PSTSISSPTDLSCRANCPPRWFSIRASCRRQQNARSRGELLLPCLRRHSLRNRREEPVGVDRRGLPARRQLIGANDRVDRPLQLFRRDRAQPVLLHVQRISEPERNVESYLLDVELHHGIVRLEKLQRLLWGSNRILGPLVERLDDAAHRFRVLVGESLWRH